MNDDDILDMMYRFFKRSIHADERVFKKDEVRFYDSDLESAIIPVVKRKQAQTLKKKIERNTFEGVPTLILFGKSFYSKDCSYNGWHGITNWTKTQTNPKMFRVSRPLSTAELMWLELHGNPIYNYHAKNNNIFSYNLKRFSFDVVAKGLSSKLKREVKPFGYYRNDFLLKHTCELLKQNYGEVLKHIGADYHKRVKENSMMFDEREKRRQVLVDKSFRQAKVYRLGQLKKNGYLFAKPVLYQQSQLNLF